VRSTERRESGGVGKVRRNGEKVDVAGVGTKFLKRGRTRQVEALNEAGSFVIDGFKVGVDHPLNSII